MRRYTRKQERAILSRAQEYVDIGYNGARKGLDGCPICRTFPLDPKRKEFLCQRSSCPLWNERNKCMDEEPNRRRSFLATFKWSIGNNMERIVVAKAHLRWLRRRLATKDFHIEIIDG